MSDSKPIPKHQEEYLHKMMKMFDWWALLFFLLFCLSFLYALGFLPSFEEELEPKTTAVAEKSLEEDPDRIENGIHLRSGLIVAEGYELVVKNCGACHSHKLVTQNRADAAGWTEMIYWMQETQGLWDLKENEAPIIAYLAKNYGVKKKSRRENLKDIDWYQLN